ncbi:MAG: SDR family NAD(P)-dependent oxidoreductase [Actinobacteria bacterium]|nr:SDR family NAD(P)-dependent oxidoreductase [Actinomycetota bacterium]
MSDRTSSRGLALQKIPSGWNAKNLPNLEGKRFLITGATSGIGKEAARELARVGAKVTIAARSLEKAESVKKELSSDRIELLELDLADLESVRRAARKVDYQIDVLILNAGIMAIPLRKTKDDFEMQMATNHLGHFAFAGLIRERVKSRIVSISSQAHRMGNFGDGTVGAIKDICLGRNKYSPWGAYGASKLANLLFTFELARIANAKEWGITAIAAHPGYSNTNLQSVAPQMKGNIWEERGTALMNGVIAQSASRGALPTLCAATFPNLYGASFIGPDGLLEMRGFPKSVRARSIAYDQELARNLWQVSEELTGVVWR